MKSTIQSKPVLLWTCLLHNLNKLFIANFASLRIILLAYLWLLPILPLQPWPWASLWSFADGHRWFGKPAWFLQSPLLFLPCRITFICVIIFYFRVPPNALDPQAIEIRPYFLRSACYKSRAYLGHTDLISFCWESNHSPQFSLSYQSDNQFIALTNLTKDKWTLAFHFLPAFWEKRN